MKQASGIILFFVALCSLGISQYLGYNYKTTKDSIKEEISDLDSITIIPSFFNKSPEDGLREALDYYDIKHPEIVYAQAVLETGHFKSNLCTNSNNLFGLYNSKKKEYYRFNHWTESIKAYINFVQYKYKPPGDYYEFLDSIGYAEDPYYINKLKGIVNRKR